MSNFNSAQPRNTYALVIMTNNDKYFISLADRARLKEEMMMEHKPIIFHTQDAKHGTKLELFTAHISSIVVEG